MKSVFANFNFAVKWNKKTPFLVLAPSSGEEWRNSKEHRLKFKPVFSMSNSGFHFYISILLISKLLTLPWSSPYSARGEKLLFHQNFIRSVKQKVQFFTLASETKIHYPPKMKPTDLDLWELSVKSCLDCAKKNALFWNKRTKISVLIRRSFG